MNFSSLSPITQELLLYNFETKIKIFLLFGFFIISLLYVFYFYPRQSETKYLLIGSLRTVIYSICYLWLWLFFILIPFILNPKVGIENLLLWLITIYSILTMIFFILFIVNANILIPTMLLKLGKYKFPDYKEGKIMENMFFKK